jgi:redox-sensitive bicupin YhaK (pirin superfamily)
MIDADRASRVLSPGLPAGDNAFVMVLGGQAKIGVDRTSVQAGKLAWLTRSDGLGSSDLVLAAGDTAAPVLLFAGRPLRQPIVFGGPFVMNTEAETKQAFADYRAGRF